ncbi:MAG: PqqD family protein [Desulfocapsaceae bacterium]|jgi:hypothetical protein|nr:PqqD family protein [Desulfocapsaceae bacterium]
MTREQALACTPVHNNVISWEEDVSGNVQIEYVLVLKPLFYSIFKRFAPQSTLEPRRKIQLDERGSQVWKMIDGRRSTSDIIIEFSSQQKVSIQESEQSVTTFFRQLGKRGLIGLR